MASIGFSVPMRWKAEIGGEYVIPAIDLMSGRPARCGDGALLRAHSTSGKISDHSLL